MQIGNIKKLFTEDRAVSPVIGVILMVAITVILAAVIGTFVLGLGDDLQDTSPTASISFDFENNDNINGEHPEVTVAHEGGDTIDDDATITLSATGSIADDGSNEELDTSPEIFIGESWSAGQSVTQDAEDFGASVANEDATWDGNTVRVNWESPDGESSATIGSSTAPTA